MRDNSTRSQREAKIMETGLNGFFVDLGLVWFEFGHGRTADSPFTRRFVRRTEQVSALIS